MGIALAADTGEAADVDVDAPTAVGDAAGGGDVAVAGAGVGAAAVGAATVGTGEGGSAATVGITTGTIVGAGAGGTVGAEVAAMVGNVPAVGLRCTGAVLVVLVATAADAPHAASIPTSTNAMMNRAKDCNTAQFLSVRQ